MPSPARDSVKGLRQSLDPEQQRAWLEGQADPPDATERSEFFEQRFKYVALKKLPQAQEVLEILRLCSALHPHPAHMCLRAFA
jgi:hypothetical protein